MEFLERVFLYLSFTAFACLLIGLYRPWIVLWWEDIQNRKKVITFYGTVGVVALLVSRVIHWI
jgi:hypothetical protein